MTANSRFFLVVFFFLYQTCLPQSGFLKTYPGLACKTTPVLQTSPDGGFVVCFGDYRAASVVTYLHKYNECGALQWSKEFSGLVPGDMIVSRTGNIFITNSYGTPQIAKLDALGNLLWCKAYNPGAY